MIDITDHRVEECAEGLRVLHGQAVYQAFKKKVDRERRYGQTQIDLCKIREDAKSTISITHRTGEECEV